MSCDLNVLVGGVGHEIGVSGHDHTCTAVGKVTQVSNDPQGVVVVERAGGFIGEHYLGRPHEESGDGDPLLSSVLAPGQPYLVYSAWAIWVSIALVGRILLGRAARLMLS